MRRRKKGKTAVRSLNIFERNPRKTIIFSLLALLLVLDYFAGVFFIPENYNLFRCPHPFYHHALVPNKRCNGKWGNSVYCVATNSLGFRDRTVRKVPLNANKRRIVFIGDSFTECLGVDYGHSFVGILSDQLAESNVEILNAAVVSYSPKLYYLKIKYLIEEIGLDFDELFVFVDNSDIPDEICYEKFEPKRYNILADVTYKLRKYLMNTSFLYYSMNTIFNRAMKRDCEEIDGLHPCFAPIDDELTAEVIRISTNPVLYWTISERMLELCGKKGMKLAAINMTKLANLCKDHNIKLTVVVYPWPHQITHQDLESIQVGFWRHFCRINSLSFINFFPLFISDRDCNTILAEYFIDRDVHWNAKGHIIVANELSKYID